jgi:Predicted inhibitor of MCP methylation, homolog of CheC
LLTLKIRVGNQKLPAFFNTTMEAAMKVEYINPFLQASKSVLKILCCADVKFGKARLKNPPVIFNQIIITIGVVGKIKGQIYFELSNETARKIASIMMGGMPISELDEISKSAISEMGNMIMGNASIILADKLIDIDITPPTLFTGDKIEVLNNIPTIVVPIELERLGTININICADEVNVA